MNFSQKLEITICRPQITFYKFDKKFKNSAIRGEFDKDIHDDAVNILVLSDGYTAVIMHVLPF